MRTATITAIYEAAKQNPNIRFLTGDYGKTYMDMFNNGVPGQCLNAGMAEQNLIGMAAGLALSGMKVFVYSIVPFVTLRCLEQIKLDIAYHNLDVTIVGVGGGFVYGTCGPTHYSIEELAALRALPNMKIVAPAGPTDARVLMEEIIREGGPAYIRLNKANEKDLFLHGYKPRLGVGHVVKEGTDITILSFGALLENALIAALMLEKDGIRTEVVHMHSLKPLDATLIRNRTQTHKGIFTLEEHNILGGFGSAVAEVIAEAYPRGIFFKRFGVNDEWPHVVGTQEFLRDQYGLSPIKIRNSIIALL